MKLTVIGCGDAFGSVGRLNTCFFLQSEKIGLLIDCGASSLPGLKLRGFKVDDVDVIVLSHFHGDHYGGVPFLLLDAISTGRAKKITIVSPPGGRERITALLDLLYPGTVVLPKLNIDFLEYQSLDQLAIGNISLIAYPVIHSEAALPHGLRITIEGKTISFSGDTSWTDVLYTLSNDADLFICECNFYSTRVNGHISYEELLTKLADIHCKQILLTHFDTEMLYHLSNVNLPCAQDGLEILIL